VREVTNQLQSNVRLYSSVLSDRLKCASVLEEVTEVGGSSILEVGNCNIWEEFCRNQGISQCLEWSVCMNLQLSLNFTVYSFIRHYLTLDLPDSRQFSTLV